MKISWNGQKNFSFFHQKTVMAQLYATICQLYAKMAPGSKNKVAVCRAKSVSGGEGGGYPPSLFEGQ